MKNKSLTYIFISLLALTFLGCGKKAHCNDHNRATKAASEAHEQLRKD